MEKDLYLRKTWLSRAFVHVQRKREEDLQESDRVIFDIRIGRLDPGHSEQGQTAGQWERRPGGIWLLRSAKRFHSDPEKAVTAIDVLFGHDAVDPRPGWEIKDPALMIDYSLTTPQPHLSVRHGNPKSPSKPIPRVNKEGKFKIIQVSDLHLATGVGVCREPEPPSTDGRCEADPRTLAFIGSVLDSEMPDLVVLTGDQVNGETAPDAQSAVFKFAEIFIRRKIPYALIFGNHDDEGSLDRVTLMSLIKSLPYSLSEPGLPTVDGVGNYVVEVLARGTSHHSALTLYLLDTHAYSPDEAHYQGYDWLKKSQIDWFRETAAALKTSPAHKDYARQHLDMAFIHIPLPEYRNIDAAHMIPDTGKLREPPTAPSFNSGFKDALVENGVIAVSCGHDHANDYCLLEGHSSTPNQGSVAHAAGKLWMCYAGGSGFGGYGGYGGYRPRRRVRVWEFDFNLERVETWKRIEGGGEIEGSDKHGRVDVSVVVDGGNVMDPLTFGAGTK